MVKRWGHESTLGEDADSNAATPVYRDQVAAMVARYSEAATLNSQRSHQEGADRKFAILSLHQAVGRSGELAWIHYDGLSYDQRHGCVVSQVPQVKTSKVKIVANVAGASRHLCWFLAWGDHLASPGDRPEYKEGQPSWVFPKLQGTHAGSTLTRYVKALAPPDPEDEAKGQGRSALKWRPVDMPRDANAAGIRKGCANLLAECMPNEHIVFATGHDLSGVSALYHYVQTTVPNCMPAAVVLAGWPQFPWGQRGLGPKPACIVTLCDVSQIPTGDLAAVVDAYFHIDSSSSPRLQRNGDLRDAVLAAFATQVMYYEERVRNNEMPDHLQHLRACLVQHAHMAMGSVDEDLMHWGGRLRVKFNLDNLHLTARTETGALAETCRLQLQRIGELQEQVSELLRAQKKLMKDAVSGAKVAGMVSEAVAAGITASRSHTVARGNAEDFNDDEVIEHENDEDEDVEDEDVEDEDVEDEDVEDEDADPITRADINDAFGIMSDEDDNDDAVAPKQQSRPRVRGRRDADGPCSNITRVLATQYYREYHERGGHAQVSKQNRHRCKLCVAWFDAVSFPKEVRDMKNKTVEIGVRKGIAKRLEHRVRHLLRDEFQRENMPAPKVSLKTSTAKLHVSSFESAVGKNKALCMRYESPGWKDEVQKWLRVNYNSDGTPIAVVGEREDPVGAEGCDNLVDDDEVDIVEPLLKRCRKLTDFFTGGSA